MTVNRNEMGLPQDGSGERGVRREGGPGRSQCGGEAGRSARGRGTSGNCVCKSCGTVYPHERGVPCTQQTCLVCGAPLTREG